MLSLLLLLLLLQLLPPPPPIAILVQKWFKLFFNKPFYRWFSEVQCEKVSDEYVPICLLPLAANIAVTAFTTISIRPKTCFFFPHQINNDTQALYTHTHT